MKYPRWTTRRKQRYCKACNNYQLEPAELNACAWFPSAKLVGRGSRTVSICRPSSPLIPECAEKLRQGEQDIEPLLHTKRIRMLTLRHHTVIEQIPGEMYDLRFLPVSQTSETSRSTQSNEQKGMRGAPTAGISLTSSSSLSLHLQGRTTSVRIE